MIDCSNTKNYLKEKARMAKADERGFCSNCDECPLYIDNNGKDIFCTYFEKLYPAEAIAIVQKWSDEHPKKTYADDFFEKFPSTPKDADGIPKVCRALVYGKRKNCGSITCFDCWNKVVEVTE